jgi:DNA-binding transcriptional LysR family regulator
MIVCNAPNMKSAAARLGVSAAAVSQAIARLERDFGVILLERGSQGIRLTPAGAALRQHASILLEAGEDLVETLDGYRNRALPRLRIYILETAARVLLPTLLTSFQGMVGNLSIQSSRRSDYVQELLRGHWDMLISQENLSEIPHIKSLPIFRERLLALVPAATLKAVGSLEEAALQLTFLKNDRPRHLHSVTMRFLRDRGLEDVRSTDCSATAAMLDLVGRGFGWCITTPLNIARLQTSYDNISCIVLPDAYTREIYLTYEDNRLMDLPENLAKECRRSLLAEIEGWQGHMPPEAAEAAEVIGALPASSEDGKIRIASHHFTDKYKSAN